MSSGDYIFIPNPANRNVHVAMRKVFLKCCSCFKIRTRAVDPILQINILQMELIKDVGSDHMKR